MSRQSLLPRTAPFGDSERASLDAVLGSATAIQRAWLAGFLAGVDAAGGQQAAAPAAPPKAAEPLTIIYASESGNCESLAGNVAKLARKQGFKPKVVDFSDLDIATLPKAGKLIAIAATWGEGEPPARAVRAYGELMGEGAPRLDGVEFGVLALGDTSYAEFCATGKAIDARFEALGAKRAVERADLDLDFDKQAADWIKNALKALAPPAADNVVAVDFAGRAAVDDDADVEPSREPVLAEVVDGQIPAGEALPSERRLAEVLGVSRPAVREALQRMAQSGLVQVRQGGATMVRDYKRYAGLDLLPRLLVRHGELDPAVARSILEARLAVGPSVAALAAAGIRPSDP